MKLFLDCEFNGWGGQLISMALVAEDGRHWYEVLPEPARWDDWCRENVRPKIDRDSLTDAQFRHSLHRFLSRFDEVCVVADWPADMVHFFNMLHGRDYTDTMNSACWLNRPVTCELIAGSPEIKPYNPHNALSDAYALRRWYMAQEKVVASAEPHEMGEFSPPAVSDWAARIDWSKAPVIEAGAGSRSTDRRVEREAREASPSRYAAAKPTPSAAPYAATSTSDAGLNVPLALAYAASFSASFPSSSASSPACDTSSSAPVDCGSF